MDKLTILANIAMLTSDQLFTEIKAGTVTIQELEKTGELELSKKRAINSLIEHLSTQDEVAWEKAKYGNEAACYDYLSQYPVGKYSDEAKRKIDYLIEQRGKAAKERENILKALKINPNAYPPGKVSQLLATETISNQDLLDCDIPISAIENLENVTDPPLRLGITPDSIPSGFTEVYFWGIKGSGKTCALGAVLHKADNMGYLNIVEGPGYHYATQLKSIFSDDNVANDYLPSASPVETTQYLPFTLKKTEEKNSRSVSLIELSGEVFKCFFYDVAKLEFPTQAHKDTFNSLNNFIKSTNRKIHFFFIDYNLENKPDEDLITQAGYLDAAATYFKNNEVFNKTTDAIYIVLTKSDLLVDENGERVTSSNVLKYAKEYLASNNYLSFINTLKDICKKNSINGGKLTVVPFTLGKVYFQKICNFQGEAAGNIVEILMQRIPVLSNSFFNFFKK